MPYLIAILVSILLLGAFLLLTVFERSREVRLFAGARAKLDRRIGRGAFVVKHVDWYAFLRHMVQTGVARIVHDIAQITLIAVRFLERLLTRTVRTLRERRSRTAPTPRTDGLRATLVYFRRNLRSRFQHKKDAEQEG